MKNFMTVFRFEFIQTVKSKTFIGVTAVFVLLTGVGMFIPNIIEAFQGGSKEEWSDDADSIGDLDTIYIVNNHIDLDIEMLKVYLPFYDIEVADNQEEIGKAIKSGDISAGIIITDNLSFEYHVNNAEMYNGTTSMVEAFLQDIHKAQVLESLGLNPTEVMNELDQVVSYEQVVHGNDGMEQMATVMVLMFLIFFMIVTYGSVIATNVASEKGNRTMELLVTSTKATPLICGKVLAGCSAVFLQGAILLTAVKGFYVLNREAWGGILDSVLDISLEVMVAFVLFGMLGYICYAFIFATCGAMVSKSEDVNSTLQPVTMLTLIVFYSVFFGINNPEGMLMKWTSFIPLSSPLAMFVRMTVVEVPVVEVAISFIILLGTTILIAWRCSSMYRRATLMYGNQVGFKKLLSRKR